MEQLCACVASAAAGVVYGLTAGTAMISVRAGSLSATVMVIVIASAGQSPSSGSPAARVPAHTTRLRTAQAGARLRRQVAVPVSPIREVAGFQQRNPPP